MRNTTLKTINIDMCLLTENKRDQMVRYFQQKGVNIEASRIGINLKTFVAKEFGQEVADKFTAQLKALQVSKQVTSCIMNTLGVSTLFAISEAAGISRLAFILGVGLYYGGPTIYNGLVSYTEQQEEAPHQHRHPL